MLAATLLLTLAALPGQGNFALESDEIHWIAPPADASVETKHYSIFLEGDVQEAEQLGKLVEAAWKQYKGILGGAPRSRGGKRTIIRVFPNRNEWRRALDLEQEVPPRDAAYQHYSPERQTVYVHEGHGDHSIEKWVLYGTFLDFHRRLKSKNKDLSTQWFVSGMADTLSTHSWDGDELVLASRALLARNNRARIAVRNCVLPYLQDGHLSDEDLRVWDVRWAITAFMMFGEGGKYLKKFNRMALGSRGSMMQGKELLPSIGDPAEITAEMVAWVQDQARSLRGLEHGQWEESGRGLRGRSSLDGYVTGAHPEEEANYFEAVCGAGHTEDHGLLLDWPARHVRVVALLRGTYLSVERHDRGRVTLVHETQVRRGPQGHCKLSLEREGHQVILRAPGARPFRVTVEGRKFGLAVGDTEAEFLDVAWR